MDNSFCICNGEIGKIKKDFFTRIWSKPPIFEYVKKVLFWLIFYGFPISMKKLKNRLFVKKSKNYLKWEFQKLKYFWGYMLENDASFLDQSSCESMYLCGGRFVLVYQNHMKNHGILVSKSP